MEKEQVEQSTGTPWGVKTPQGRFSGTAVMSRKFSCAGPSPGRNSHSSGVLQKEWNEGMRVPEGFLLR